MQKNVDVHGMVAFRVTFEVGSNDKPCDVLSVAQWMPKPFWRYEVIWTRDSPVAPPWLVWQAVATALNDLEV